MKDASRWARACFLAGGVGLLGFLVWRVGFEEVLRLVGKVGWGIVPVLCVSTLWKANNVLAWMLAFPPRESPSFWQLYVVNLAGDVVNNMLPMANLGGELAKPYLLQRETPVARSMSAVVANKTMEIVSGLIFIGCCVCLALFYLPLAAPLRLGMVLAVLVGGAAVGLLCLVQRRGLFIWLQEALCRLSFLERFLASKREGLAQVDQSLKAFYKQNQRRFLGCLGLRLSSWILGALETYLILHLLGVDPTILTALLLVALPMMIDAAFFFIPANMGTSEAGHTYVSLLLGLNPAVGLSLSLVKRFRRLFWMAVGSILLSSRISYTFLNRKVYEEEDIGQVLS